MPCLRRCSRSDRASREWVGQASGNGPRSCMPSSTNSSGSNEEQQLLSLPDVALSSIYMEHGPADHIMLNHTFTYTKSDSQSWRETTTESTITRTSPPATTRKFLESIKKMIRKYTRQRKSSFQLWPLYIWLSFLSLWYVPLSL